MNFQYKYFGAPILPLFRFYSGQKKKLNGPEVAKYFSPVGGGVFFVAPVYYGRSSPLYPLVRR